MHARDAARHRLEAGLDRGTGVLAAELAELALARQQPQRVGDLGAQARAQVVGARERLEPLPRRDRAHRCPSRNARLSASMAALIMPARLIDGVLASMLNGEVDRGQEPAHRVEVVEVEGAHAGEGHRLAHGAGQAPPSTSGARRLPGTASSTVCGARAPGASKWNETPVVSCRWARRRTTGRRPARQPPPGRTPFGDCARPATASGGRSFGASAEAGRSSGRPGERQLGDGEAVRTGRSRARASRTRSTRRRGGRRRPGPARRGRATVRGRQRVAVEQVGGGGDVQLVTVRGGEHRRHGKVSPKTRAHAAEVVGDLASVSAEPRSNADSAARARRARPGGRQHGLDLLASAVAASAPAGTAPGPRRRPPRAAAREGRGGRVRCGPAGLSAADRSAATALVGAPPEVGGVDARRRDARSGRGRGGPRRPAGRRAPMSPSTSAPSSSRSRRPSADAARRPGGSSRSSPGGRPRAPRTFAAQHERRAAPPARSCRRRRPGCAAAHGRERRQAQVGEPGRERLQHRVLGVDARRRRTVAVGPPSRAPAQASTRGSAAWRASRQRAQPVGAGGRLEQQQEAVAVRRRRCGVVRTTPTSGITL